MLHWFRRRLALSRSVDDDVREFQRRLLHYVIKRMDAMALDLSKLQAAADRNGKAVAALVATHTDPAAQKAVDDVAAVLDTVSASAEAAVAPVTPAA